MILRDDHVSSRLQRIIGRVSSVPGGLSRWRVCWLNISVQEQCGCISLFRDLARGGRCHRSQQYGNVKLDALKQDRKT